jgi:hypothetical protein
LWAIKADGGVMRALLSSWGGAAKGTNDIVIPSAGFWREESAFLDRWGKQIPRSARNDNSMSVKTNYNSMLSPQTARFAKRHKARHYSGLLVGCPVF